MGKRGRGQPPISNTICEEFIALRGKRVQAEIISQVQRSKYFAMILPLIWLTLISCRLWSAMCQNRAKCLRGFWHSFPFSATLAKRFLDQSHRFSTKLTLTSKTVGDSVMIMHLICQESTRAWEGKFKR